MKWCPPASVQHSHSLPNRSALSWCARCQQGVWMTRLARCVVLFSTVEEYTINASITQSNKIYFFYRKTRRQGKYMSILIFSMKCRVFNRHPALRVSQVHIVSPIWSAPVEIPSESQDPCLGTDTHPRGIWESQTWRVLQDFGLQFFSWLWVRRQRQMYITMDLLYFVCWH